MQINVADYKEILYSSLGITMDFELSGIKECFIHDGIFTIVGDDGISADFCASNVQFIKKVS